MICRWDRGLASEVECFAPRLRKPDSAPSLSSILIPPCVIPIPPLTPNPATQHLPAPPSRSPPKHAPTRTLTSHPTPSHPSLTHRPSPSNPPSPSRPSQPYPLCVYTPTVPYRTPSNPHPTHAPPNEIPIPIPGKWDAKAWVRSEEREGLV